MKKLFGEIDMTWKKVILIAVIAGLYTGLMAFLPAAKDTSFADISITFEVWILFGILIIVNSGSPLDAALKCFVFFLISQPLVYLVQVPFNVYGWGIFAYYRNWFLWTLFTFPMGYIGYYMKKDKWWGLLILAPMLAFLAFHYHRFLRDIMTAFPHHLLTILFIVVTMIIYPLYIFKDKKIRLAGLAVSIALLLAATVFAFVQGGSFYNTTLITSGGETAGLEFDDTYTVRLSDDSFGEVSIVYEENIEDYMVNAAFKKEGDTQLIMTAPGGGEYVYQITVYSDHYDIRRIAEPE
ncbi:MAG: hypothetical protein K6B12_00570 [Clostridiales bacterium]|nr:hypothetical protein [Clostridiales bacterium]